LVVLGYLGQLILEALVGGMLVGEAAREEEDVRVLDGKKRPEDLPPISV
jgi:hypothetical protein